MTENCSHNVYTDISPSVIESMLSSLNTLENKIRDGDIIYGMSCPLPKVGIF